MRPLREGLEVSVPPGVALRGEIRLTSIAGDVAIPVIAGRTAAAPTVPPPRRARPTPVAGPPDPGRFKGRLWPGQAPVAYAYAIIGLVLGVPMVGGVAPTGSWFSYTILAYTVLRLIESFRGDTGTTRQRCVWGLCAFGLLAGLWVFTAHAAGPVLLIWLVVAAVEFFGRLIDRIRAGTIVVVSGVTLGIVAGGATSDVDQFLNVLNGMLPIALGLITLAPVLIPRFR